MSMDIYSLLSRNLMFPICERLYDSEIMHTLAVLNSNNMISRDLLCENQNRSLERLILHAYNNVRYYRELFKKLKLVPSDVKRYEDLCKLPILTKQIIRENYDSLISMDAHNRHVRYHSTGGSTGTPLRYLSDSKTWSAAWASTFRAWNWYGLEVGEKIFTLAGSSLVKNRSKFSRKDIFESVLLRNLKRGVSCLKNSEMESHYNALVRFNPVAVRGYPSALYAFACYVEALELPLPPVRVVLTTGEILLPAYRNKISTVFNAPVFDSYGAGDGGIAAHECLLLSGLHITEERCIIEICDQRDMVVSNGVSGNVISTDLFNYTFPFIRYKVGDVSYIMDDECSCGRSSRRLGEILGRSGRLLYNLDGEPVSPTMLPVMLYRDMDYHNLSNQTLYNNIDKFQIRQDSAGDLEVLLKFKIEEDGVLQQYGYITDNFINIFPGSTVQVRQVSQIPQLPSGKEDYMWSEFTHEYRHGKDN